MRIPSVFFDVWTPTVAYNAASDDLTIDPPRAGAAYALTALNIAAAGDSAALTQGLRRYSPQGLLERITEAAGDQDSRESLSDLIGIRPRTTQAIAQRLSLVEQTLVRAAKGGQQVITDVDAEMPRRFTHLGSDSPRVLWLRGDAGLIEATERAVTIQGARAASTYGNEVARQIAASAGLDGVTVVAGANHGIALEAHDAAQKLGHPSIMVSSRGLDEVHPIGAVDIFTRAVNEGLVISQYAPGVSATHARVAQAGRLLAAASDVTVIVEAHRHSRAMGTAQTAHIMGRTLVAVPGPVTSPASDGPHHLIATGHARLVRGWSEIADLMAPTWGSRAPSARHAA